MARLLKDGEEERLQQAAPVAVIGAGGYYSLTIAQWHGITKQDLSVISDRLTDKTRCTVYDYYTIKGLSAFVDSYIKQLERFAVKPDAAETAAQRACYDVTATEGMLIFAREYFGLQSFAAAEQVTLGDFLLAKKDTYNKTMFQKAYTAQLNKRKAKK